MVNCEPPPGSTLIDCNTAIIEKGLDAHTDQITVDSVVVHSRTYKKSRLHGRLNPVTLEYDYNPVPIEFGEDYE
jgi:hypothetical protein